MHIETACTMADLPLLTYGDDNHVIKTKEKKHRLNSTFVAHEMCHMVIAHDVFTCAFGTQVYVTSLQSNSLQSNTQLC